jgi:hypothetical protein
LCWCWATQQHCQQQQQHPGCWSQWLARGRHPAGRFVGQYAALLPGFDRRMRVLQCCAGDIHVTNRG